jgi:hypothetical protein
MIVDQVRNLLRAACNKAGAQRTWAKKAGLSTAYVSDVLAGKRMPGRKVLAALGIKATLTYHKRRG